LNNLIAQKALLLRQESVHTILVHLWHPFPDLSYLKLKYESQGVKIKWFIYVDAASSMLDHVSSMLFTKLYLLTDMTVVIPASLLNLAT
jgi:hypothetical protein